ncbi:MAG: ATP-binding protein, partial [bacterium]
GIETARRLRSEFSIPVVYLTAATDRKTVKRAKGTKPLGYLSKPIDSGELFATLEVALHNLKVETELVKSREYAEEIIRNFLDTLVVTDRNGEIKKINEATIELLGYEKEQLLGEHIFKIFAPGEEEAVMEIFTGLQKEIHKTGEIRNVQLDYQTASGELIPMSFNASTIKDPEGKVTGVVAGAKDISDLKEAQRKLSRAEKLAAIGEMAAGIMHEINNPNSFIKGNIEFIEKIVKKLLDAVKEGSRPDELEWMEEEVFEAVQGLKQGSKRISEIVNNVKLFSRRETEENYYERFDLHKIFRQVIKQYFKVYGAREFEFVVENSVDEGEEVGVYGSAGEIEQVLSNLIDNAIDAVDERETPGKIIISLEKSCGRAIVSVADNGPEIPEDIQDKIFDPFFTTKKPGKGTGLGLSISSAIIEHMGGEMQLESGPKKGAEFIITLPLEKE